MQLIIKEKDHASGTAMKYMVWLTIMYVFYLIIYIITWMAQQDTHPTHDNMLRHLYVINVCFCVKSKAVTQFTILTEKG